MSSLINKTLVADNAYNGGVHDRSPYTSTVKSFANPDGSTPDSNGAGAAAGDGNSPKQDREARFGTGRKKIVGEGTTYVGVATPPPKPDTDLDPGSVAGGSVASGSVAGGSVAGGSASGSGATTTATEPAAASTPADANRSTKRLLTTLTGDPGATEIAPVAKYDKQPQIDMLNQQIEAARQKYVGQIDRGTDLGVAELRRAVADAQGQFQTERDQIAANEMNALDNSALYAEARGDRGGIGQAQYNGIQNTAAQNRAAVNAAQVKLATDTSRQIGDLRARGEYDKADAMLDLTQNYLSELRSIEEYAANYNLSVDQINTAIAEWEAEYAKSMQQFRASTEMSLAQMTGEFSDGTKTLAALNATNNNLASMAMSLIEAGMSADKLTEAQKKALMDVYGMNAEELAAVAALNAKSGGGGSYTVPPKTGFTDEELLAARREYITSGGKTNYDAWDAYLLDGVSSGEVTPDQYARLNGGNVKG